MDSQQFKNVRKSLGMTQNTLAKMLDKSLVTVAAYEAGRRTIPDAVSDQLARLQPVVKAPGPYDAFITPLSHPHLYKKSKDGFGTGALHPRILLPGVRWPTVGGSDNQPRVPLWVLERPEYLQALERALATPAAPKPSQEEWERRVQAGVPLAELNKPEGE